MYPFLLPEVFGYTIPLYDVMIVLGCFFMLLYVLNRLEKNGYNRAQTNRIGILLVISLFLALASSWVFDGIFHSIQAGELDFGSITFIGGLIGGVVAFVVLMKYFYKDDNKDMKTIMNATLTGVVLAHAFGRIGCFFAGCCFGIPTESFLGVIFPSGHAHDLYPDQAVYPTQLFEAFFLFLLFIALNKVNTFKNIEVQIYLVSYGIWRFAIEFIRGDDRGELFPLITTEYNVFPTPSQFLSVLMVLLGGYLLYRTFHQPNNHVHQ